MEPASEEATAPATIQFPHYWELLNDADKLSYLTMRQALSSSVCKHRRNHSNEISQEIIGSLHAFVMRNDADDWRRGLVCGICWLNGGIAINTRQLRILLSRCKSSINAMFQNIGYVAVPTTNDYATALSGFFPTIKDNFGELRQWTIRAIKPSSIGPGIPPDATLDPSSVVTIPPNDLELAALPDVDLRSSQNRDHDANQDHC
jgi:hypothetical protein